MSIMVQPAGGGGKSPEEIVADKFLFSLPDGDAGLSRDRKWVEFSAEAGLSATYAPGDTTYINMPSSGDVLDAGSAYLSFTISCSGFAGIGPAAGSAATAVNRTAYPILPHGAQTLIQQLDVTSFGGTTLESLPDYDVVAAQVDKWTLTEDWRRMHGELEAFPPEPEAPASALSRVHPGNALQCKADGSWASAQVTATAGGFAATHITAASAIGVAGVTQSILSGANMAGAIADNVGVAYGQRSRMLRYCQSFQKSTANSMTGETAGRQVLMPLRHSGLFGSEKVIPLNALGQMRLAIKWNAPAKCFQMVCFAPTVPQAGRASGADDPLTSPDVNNSNNFTLAANSLTYRGEFHDRWRDPPCGSALSGIEVDTRDFRCGTYTITNVKLICPVITVSAGLQEAMNNAIAGSGIPLHFRTYFRQRQQFPANSSGQFSVIAPKSVSSASSLLAFFYTDPANSPTPAAANDVFASTGAAMGGPGFSAISNKYDSWQHGVSQWQFRLGTQYYPRLAVRDAMTGYVITSEAFPKPPMNDRRPCVPFHRYSAQNSQFYPVRIATPAAGVLLSASDVATNAPQRAYFCPAVHLDDRSYPNCFAMGTSLQSTPGVELAGVSTVSGAQPSLEFTLNNASSYAYNGVLQARNDRVDLISDLFFVVWYRRVCIITAGQNVVVKE